MSIMSIFGLNENYFKSLIGYALIVHIQLNSFVEIAANSQWYYIINQNNTLTTTSNKAEI